MVQALFWVPLATFTLNSNLAIEVRMTHVLRKKIHSLAKFVAVCKKSRDRLLLQGRWKASCVKLTRFLDTDLILQPQVKAPCPSRAWSRCAACCPAQPAPRPRCPVGGRRAAAATCRPRVTSGCGVRWCSARWHATSMRGRSAAVASSSYSGRSATAAGQIHRQIGY